MGPIALVGGDEFRAGCEPMDGEILAVAGATLSQGAHSAHRGGTGRIPRRPPRTASRTSMDWARRPTRSWSSTPRTPTTTAWSPAWQVVRCDVPHRRRPGSHLLEVLRGSRLLDAIMAAVAGRTVLAGSSAGAMVLGEWMRYGGVSPGAGSPGRPGGSPPPRAEQPGRGRRRACGVRLPRGLRPRGSTRESPALAEETPGGSSVTAPSSYTAWELGAAIQTGEPVPLSVSLHL